MILGVMSDTHGNLQLLYRAADLMRDAFKASHIIHLGDDWEDKITLEYAGYFVSGVPGLWCSAYSTTGIPKARVDAFGGLGVAYAHSDNDLPPIASSVGLILTGHTHRATIQLRQGVPFMNPGHLKSVADRGRPASFGLADISEASLRLSIHGLSGEIIACKTFPRHDLPETQEA